MGSVTVVNCKLGAARPEGRGLFLFPRDRRGRGLLAIMIVTAMPFSDHRRAVKAAGRLSYFPEFTFGFPRE